MIIAYNCAENPALPALRYEDDDGVLWAETLGRLGYDVTLLTLADAQTARLGSPALGSARPPSRAEVALAVKQIRRENDAAHGQRKQVDVLVVYVGHGDVDEAGRSYLNLLDGRMDRSALLTGIVDQVGADYVHLLLDACRAGGLVGSRGQADPRILAELQATLEKEQLSARPNVGAITAQTDSGEVHEWSRLQAGVFSHALRSGLVGGADVNEDGKVEYSELEAFLAAALSGMEAMRSKMRVHVLAPLQDRRRPLVDHSPEGPSILLARGLPYGRVFIEDSQGRPLVEIHRAVTESVKLSLPARRSYWIRSAGEEARVEAEHLGEFPVLFPVQTAQRGPVEESFARGLFSRPYGRDFYSGYVAQADLVPVDFAHETLESADDGSALPPLGMEVSALVGGAPLSAPALSYGVAVGLLRPLGPLRVGVLASYQVAPRAWLEASTLHRVSVLGLARLERLTGWQLFAEAGVGWALIAATRASGTQGDSALPTGELGVGGSWQIGGAHLRVAATLTLDLVRLDATRRPYLAPALRLGLEL
ncbi:MAG: caspase family protein [Myxococcaceae bacterium]